MSMMNQKNENTVIAVIVGIVALGIFLAALWAFDVI
jgi:hypothetical protein